MRQNLELFVISFVTLFLEMLLIRWIGAEVRIFAYLSNFILIACFLGFGIGCFQANLPFKPLQSIAIIAAIVLLVAEPKGLSIIPFRDITRMLGGASFDLPIWSTPVFTEQLFTVFLLLGGIALTVLLFLMVVFALIPLGRRIGHLFENHPRLTIAYSVNIIGSLIGTWAFAALSYLSTPPWQWFILFFVIFLFLVPKRLPAISFWFAAGCAIVISLVPWGGETATTYWSPYQKLVLSPLRTEDGKVQRGYLIEVNNVGYQAILNLSREFLSKHSEHFDLGQASLSPYDVPYELLTGVRRVLIVGAGAGNDCAAALRHGVQEVDCVEIDPVIASLGKQYHPEKPYDNPRVRLIVDDARSFFRQTPWKYDLVWFGLLDSHTLGSAYNNLRLDHYVYTKESFEAARNLLEDKGVLVLFFETEVPWITERIFGLIKTVFGYPPLTFVIRSHGDYYGWGGTLYIVGRNGPVTISEKVPEDIRRFLKSSTLQVLPQVELTTDDWPFLYLPSRTVPLIHIVVSGILFVLFLGFRNRILLGGVSFDWRFFCLGAGFLLIEVQSVTKAGLLFGSTWIVNCLIVSQILVWILLSNLVYLKFRIERLNWVFALLFIDLLFIYLFPVDYFSQLALLPRLVLGSVHLTVPVFFAGLIFINLFNKCPSKSSALGANLIGALAGGLLESLAFISGQKSLLLVAGLFYCVAILLLVFGSSTATRGPATSTSSG